MARRIGGSKHVAVAVAAVLTLTFAPASNAAAPSAWSAKANEIAATWPGLQLSDGSFRDYVIARDPAGVRDDYGDPMLGYALLLTAARTGDGALADSGLRALEFSLDRAARSPSTQVFHQLAVVSAYNLARTRFPTHPVFTRARERWEEVLRRIEVYRIGRRAITNKSIVEAILLIELTRSGLAGGPPGSALADRSGTLALVKRFLARDLPRAARPYERAGRALLGDMPLLPPSYHALSVGMLARTIELLGDQAPSAARGLLKRAARASLAAAGPDGDVAYHGRSQSQAWAMTLTGYGAGLAGQAALARRAVGRILDYPTGPEGFLVTPSLAEGIEAAIPGIDEYVAAASYVGLTLSSLEWAIATGADGSAGASPGGVFVLGRGSGQWATSRTGDVWFAVKRARTSVRDLRYDVGLISVKVRSGPWQDVVPLRPRTLRGDQSAGPLLGGGAPYFTSFEPGKRGRIVARGGFRKRSGRWVRRGVRFTFAPLPCGVRIAWNARAGDRYTYSEFFTREPFETGTRLSDGMHDVHTSSQATVATDEGYSSGANASLTRAVLRFEQQRNGTAAIEVCAR
jgi:hypothetical protein